jgi:hypothetical protein
VTVTLAGVSNVCPRNRMLFPDSRHPADQHPFVRVDAATVTPSTATDATAVTGTPGRSMPQRSSAVSVTVDVVWLMGQPAASRTAVDAEARIAGANMPSGTVMPRSSRSAGVARGASRTTTHPLTCRTCR